MKHAVEQYLHVHQPQIYHLFSHALKEKKWSHAYLLSGNENTPLLDIAQFLAQSLLCESPHPLADQTCLTCQRIMSGHFTDIKVFNGEESSIKKQDILDLESSFSITGLENAQKYIYILHRVESMTPEAINALLKFLEEPTLDIYAILTTEAFDKILPTIVSRSQVIQLKPTDRQKLVEEAVEKNISIEDALLLSLTHSTVESMESFIQSGVYQPLKTAFMHIVSNWSTSPEKARFLVRQELLPLLDNKLITSMVLQWLQYFLWDVLQIHLKQGIFLKSYDTIILGLSSKISHPNDLLMMVMKARKQLDYNLSIPLLIDELFIKLTK